MKKIYFDDISNFKKNWWRWGILFLSMILIFNGTFTDSFSENWSKWIKAAGFLIISIYFLNKVIRKNYVQWNKFGMTIRINNYFQEKRLTFNEIISYEFINDKLRIIQTNKTIELDLNNVLDSDRDKLIQIIADNTGANTL